MDEKLKAAMLEATRLTGSGRFAEATALIQRALRGSPGAEEVPSAERRPEPDIIEGDFEVLDEGGAPAAEEGGGPSPGPGFSSGTFASAAGTRDYKLYVPSQSVEPAPLLVMLHGCTQGPDAFAAVSRMNELAEEVGFLVLYPAQSASANASNCWNWYSPENQRRGQGEPAIVAAMTRHVTRLCRADERRVFVAGFSAGGALAAIMAVTYPELLSAVGIHSGVPYGVAQDMVSAMAAMAQGVPDRDLSDGLSGSPVPPIIVFHGDADTTVNPSNARSLIAQLVERRQGAAGELRVERRNGRVEQGFEYSRWLYRRREGRVAAELWMAHGAGHVWLGGTLGHPFGEPRGPDASREMLRFFLASGMPATERSDAP